MSLGGLWGDSAGHKKLSSHSSLLQFIIKGAISAIGALHVLRSTASRKLASQITARAEPKSFHLLCAEAQAWEVQGGGSPPGLSLRGGAVPGDRDGGGSPPGILHFRRALKL